MWDSLFGFANLFALIAWAVLLFAPRPAMVMNGLLYGAVGLLAASYALGLILLFSGVIPATGGVDFGSIAGVRAIFASDAGVTIGWVHYLAFDLFVGLWIARDADRRGINRFIQAPILVLTFMAGPFGLTLYFLLRLFRRTTETGTAYG